MKLKKKTIHFQSIFKADLWNTVHNILQSVLAFHPVKRNLWNVLQFKTQDVKTHFNSCKSVWTFVLKRMKCFYFSSRLSGTFHPVFEDV